MCKWGGYMEYILVLVSVAIALIVFAVLIRRFDTCEKIDKGVELCYWKLSYRRKFIRTLWMVPVDVIIICGFHIRYQNCLLTCAFLVISVIVIAIQAVYNYKKWKVTKK